MTLKDKYGRAHDVPRGWLEMLFGLAVPIVAHGFMGQAAISAQGIGKLMSLVRRNRHPEIKLPHYSILRTHLLSDPDNAAP